jgi:hypothetical protein
MGGRHPNFRNLSLDAAADRSSRISGGALLMVVGVAILFFLGYAVYSMTQTFCPCGADTCPGGCHGAPVTANGPLLSSESTTILLLTACLPLLTLASNRWPVRAVAVAACGAAALGVILVILDPVRSIVLNGLVFRNPTVTSWTYLVPVLVGLGSMLTLTGILFNEPVITRSGGAAVVHREPSNSKLHRAPR